MIYISNFTAPFMTVCISQSWSVPLLTLSEINKIVMIDNPDIIIVLTNHMCTINFCKMNGNTDQCNVILYGTKHSY